MDDDFKLDPKFLSEIGAMAEHLNELQIIGTELLTPEVDSIIRNKITNEKTIEHLFDQLLSYAACDKGLALFKRLLRYYYPINPGSVAFYINAYREMYDDDYQVEDDNE